MTPKRILLAILVAIPTLIALQNLDEVYVEVLFWNWNIPLIYLIVLSFATGFGAGWLGHVTLRRKKDH